jgi:hypothetical protein
MIDGFRKRAMRWAARICAPVASRLKCSFCRKRSGDVRNLIAGPKVYICNECVGVCQDILAAEKNK